MEILAFALSTLGTVCVCIPPLLKGKNMKLILLFVFSSNALVATSYVLTGAFTGAASCFVGSVQTIINYFFDRKNKQLPKWLLAAYALSFIVVNLLVFNRLTDLIALLGTLVFIAAISQKNGKQYRLWILINTLLWITYDLVSLSFGPLSTHLIQLTTIVVGMVVHDRNRSTKTE